MDRWTQEKRSQADVAKDDTKAVAEADPDGDSEAGPPSVDEAGMEKGQKDRADEEHQREAKKQAFDVSGRHGSFSLRSGERMEDTALAPTSVGRHVGAKEATDGHFFGLLVDRMALDRDVLTGVIDALLAAELHHIQTRTDLFGRKRRDDLREVTDVLPVESGPDRKEEEQGEDDKAEFFQKFHGVSSFFLAS